MFKTKITNIVVCYKNEDSIFDYASEISRQNMSNAIFLIVVINSASSLESVKLLDDKMRTLNIRYQIVNPCSNIGYLNGMIFGYKNCDKTEWYAISNTDVKINSKTFFSDFFETKKINELNDIGVIGPKVFYPKLGYYKDAYLEKRPTKFSYMITNFLLRFPTLHNYFHSIKRKKPKESINNNSRYVYAVEGSFIFVKSSVLEAISQKEPWELLYDEEQYLSEVALQIKQKTYFMTNISIDHLAGITTSKINLRNNYKLLRKANKRILKEFY